MNLVYLWGSFLFKYRNTVFPVFLVILFVLFPPVLFGGTLASDIRLDLVGVGLCLLGQAVRGAVIGFAYIKRGGLNKKVYADTLVTRGIFGVCRNPLYVGNLLAAAGILVVHNNPWVYLIAGLFTLASYQAIVLTEERFLRNKFGEEFEQYCREVSRWMPRLSKLRGATDGMVFQWGKVITKDYSTCCTWVVIVSLLFMYEAYRSGMSLPSGRIIAGCAILVTAAAFSLVVHRYKKNISRKRVLQA
ncbi:isoprenylcysteine carboxylmethyltransferase family protein [Haloferula sp. BvORR071]|uniref:methyltransferase family protein n=1 Tax=Haloferula sp. BvORR071 TaxID=1396141 RepID=UPI000550FC45|nr:isoprenylcysteine carboxylmethyltransferase family protein [Haloferula sp. BvORR071]